MPEEEMVYRVQYEDENGEVVDEDIVVNTTRVKERVFDTLVASLVGIVVGRAVGDRGNDD